MTKLALVATLAIIMAMPNTSEGAITCGFVTSKVIPCLSYLRSVGPLIKSCCNGVSDLNKAAQTTADRQATCKCLKQAATAITGLNAANTAGLPGKCGVSIPYKISTSTDCASVK